MHKINLEILFDFLNQPLYTSSHMKSKFYFFLAHIFVKLTFWFDNLSIRSNMYRKLFEIRAIYYSEIPSIQKTEMMKEVK